MKPAIFQNLPRLSRHVVLWLVVWLFIRYINYGLYVKDADWLLNILSLISLGQTVALFYLFGYVILPQYLYKFRFLPFLAITALIYYVVFLNNYLTAYFLHQYSNAGTKVLMIHTQQGWELFREAGLLGCFTNAKVAFLTIGNSFFVVIPLLIGKVIKDLLTYRTRLLIHERDIIERERSNLTLERDNLSLELDTLKAQVNPHFLFNALNSIYARVVDANEPAAELVLRLSELMRYNLYEANVEKIALTDEMAYIENYLSLEKIRHASLVDVIFSADTDFSGYRIAPLLLIAFVENAFKHGLVSGGQTAYVLVEAEIQATTFCFTVQNSVLQHQPASVDKQVGGVGLQNLQKRLNLLYPDQYALDINHTQTSYAVILQLQLDALT